MMLIDYEHYRGRQFLTGNEEVLDRIAHRVFFDYCVNGFLVNDNVFNYGTRIHERPEFLMSLSDLLPDARKIEQYWETHAESYRVDFFVKEVKKLQRRYLYAKEKNYCNHSSDITGSFGRLFSFLWNRNRP